MISQRYSNDRVDSNDLKRSFVSILPFSLIAFFALAMFHFVPVMAYVQKSEFRLERIQKTVLSYFCNSDSYLVSFIQIGMVLCGILMAFSLFQFLMKKKSVNVYLSFGMTRSKLYFNRLFAAVLSLFICTFIPTFITFILNLIYFGASSHLTSLFCYMFLMEFVSGLAGFALASAVMTISGCMVEAAITVTGLSAWAFLINTITNYLSQTVRGYNYNVSSDLARNAKFTLFNIWAFATDLEPLTGKSTEYNYQKTFVTLGKLTKKASFEADQCIDLGVLLPLIIWLVISIVIVGIVWLLINRRKSENSNSFGKFYLTSALNGVTVFLIALSVISSDLSYRYYNVTTSPLFQNLGLCLLMILGVTLIAFFVAVLIIRRNFKGTLRVLPVYAVAFAVTVLVFVYYSTGCFGTYNKLPDISEIKSVSMDVNDNRGNILDNAAISSKYLSENAEDIKTAASLFEAVRDDSYYKGAELEGLIGFKFVLKDGTEIARNFMVFTPDVYNKYNRTVYDTQFYKNFLKYVLVDNHGSVSSDNIAYYTSNGASYDAVYASEAYTGGTTPVDKTWYYVGPSFLVDKYSTKYGTDNLDALEETDGLLEAVYKDFIAMSYDDAHTNSRTPVGAITTHIEKATTADSKLIVRYGSYYVEDDYAYYDNSYDRNEEPEKIIKGMANYSLYIYPNMTNTIKYLNDNGITPLAYTGKVKEVYYADTNYTISSILSHHADGSKLSDSYKAFDISYALSIYNYGVADDDSPAMSYMDFIKNAYTGTGIELKTVSGAKAEEIVSKSVPYYEPDRGTEFKGKAIIVVYDDNSITGLYVPEGNTGVFG